LRLSPEILEHLKSLELTPDELLKLPSVQAPPIDDSHPIEHYFISSSHNTYLLGRQLIGRSSSTVYSHVLTHGARCIEIDVWPSSKGLVVTHGYTLSKSVPFAEVCEAISGAVSDEDWPVMVSLECHVGVPDQPGMVQIMEQAWGNKLVRHQVAGLDVERVTPLALRGKIILLVEYYPPKDGSDETEEQAETPSSPSSEDSEEWHSHVLSTLDIEKGDRSVKEKISDTLAALGPYARSMKPKKNWLVSETPYPVPILINISESSIDSLPPQSQPLLVSHAQEHLRRVYPKGTRVASGNQDPVKQWRNGSHIACLNWQKYDDGMQMNEAMFVGTPGWVLKPAHMLGLGDAPTPQEMKIIGKVVGVSALPCPNDTLHFSSYVRVELMHTKSTHQWKSKSIKAKAASKEAGIDIMWNQRFEFQYEYDELAFIRLLFQEDELGRDDKLAVFCAKLDHIQQGWRLVRLLDMKGKASGATVLVNFKIEAL